MSEEKATRRVDVYYGSKVKTFEPEMEHEDFLAELKAWMKECIDETPLPPEGEPKEYTFKVQVL